MNDEVRLFSCFSVPLMKFLTNQGVRYELVALNPNTKNTMWIYVKDKKLDELLNTWKETKPKN